MSTRWFLAWTFTLAGLVGQQVAVVQPAPDAVKEEGNLPMQKIGVDDLVGVSVYGAPELTRTVRVASDGSIHLPMVKSKIPASGLYPVDLEKSIAAELVKEWLFVDPAVTVTVAEYRSRPISVVGAVRQPLTFQAMGEVTLLNALARAGGLSDNAGSFILVSRQVDENGASVPLVRRIPVSGLIKDADPELNISLKGGEEIRVPDAGQIFVVGNVKKPGAFTINRDAQTSVLKVLAMSEGLLPYSQKSAYIYRSNGDSGPKAQIPIDLKKIMDRQAPDVAVLPNDILYVPEDSSKKWKVETAGKVALVGSGLAAALVYVLK